jgi:hypothetical protein
MYLIKSSIQFVDINSANKHHKDKQISLLYGLNLLCKTTFLSAPQILSEVLKYYYKSLLNTNASPEFDSEKEITILYGWT